MPKALNVEDYVGNVYGRLTVLRGEEGTSNVVCECACGQGVEFITRLSDLKVGKPKSCGCRNLPLIGEKYTSKLGLSYEVIAYVNAVTKAGKSFRKMLVKFCDTGYETVSGTKEVRNGNIKDPLHTSVVGIGFLGSTDVDTRSKAYQAWRDMLKRCYAPSSERVARQYKGCTVTEVWYNFLNFRSWYEPRHKGNYQIDKDLLCMGNKIYSPETCTMVPVELNGFLTGGLSTGAHYSKSKNVWVAQCQDGEKTATGNKKQTYLGSYKTEREAIDAYKVFKLSKLDKLKEDYGEELPPVIFENVEKFIKQL